MIVRFDRISSMEIFQHVLLGLCALVRKSIEVTYCYEILANIIFVKFFFFFNTTMNRYAYIIVGYHSGYILHPIYPYFEHASHF